MTEYERKRALRLIEALEVLISEEEISFQAGTKGIAAIQRRSTPLVNELAKLADLPGIEPLRPRVQQLIRRRQAQTARMEARLAEIKDRMAQLNQSRGNLRRMAPMYKATPKPRYIASMA